MALEVLWQREEVSYCVEGGATGEGPMTASQAQNKRRNES